MPRVSRKTAQLQRQSLVIHVPFHEQPFVGEHIQLLAQEETIRFRRDWKSERTESRPLALSSGRYASWKILMALVVCGLICSYWLEHKQQILRFQNYNYRLLPTAYDWEMLGLPIKTHVFSLFRPSANFLQIYVPEHSVYYNDERLGPTPCVLSYQDQCWREYLMLKGSMVPYLEYWAIKTSTRGSKILVFWQQKLSLTVLLLSIRLSQLSHSTASILVMSSPKQPKAELNALRLNLIKENSTDIVTFVESEQFLLPEQLTQYDIVIGDSHIFHEDIIAGFMAGRDLDEGNVQNEVAYSIYSAFIRTKLILVYDHQIQPDQQRHYCVLQNQVLKLVSDGQKNCRQEVVSGLQQLHFEQQPAILIIESRSGMVKCQNRSDSIYEFKQEQWQSIVPNAGSKSRDDSSAMQAQFQHPIVIERIELKSMKQILPCRQKHPDGYLLYQQTQFKDIEVMTRDIRDLQYLAKFLIYFFRTEQMPMSVLYAQNSQLLCSLIAKINDGNLFIETNIIQRPKQIIEVLQHNKLNRLLHPISVGEDIDIFLDRQAIRLVVIDLVYLVQWQREIFDSSHRVTVVLLPRNGNSNEVRTIENLAQDKSIHVYVISGRQDQDYDVECFHEFQWRAYASNVKYPPNSYYFILKQSYNLQPINPNDYPNLTIHRSMQIQPYNCQFVPDMREDEQVYEQKFIMITDKYYVPYLIPKQQYNMFDIQQVGDDGIIQFMQSNLFSSDRVLFYAESTQNILMNLIAIGIVKRHGSTTFTICSEQRKNVLWLSAIENGLENSYQISEIQSYDQFGVQSLLIVYKPTVVFIDPKYLQRDMSILKDLAQQALIIFKYVDYVQTFQQYLSKLVHNYNVYQVVLAPTIQVRGNCNVFTVQRLTGNNFAAHKFGWFVIAL